MRVLEPLCQVEKFEITPTQQGALKRNIWSYHLIVEFWNSPFELLAKAKIVEKALKSALTNSNYNNIRVISYQFQPFGVSAQVSSGRANIYIHTWPENGYSAIDIIADSKDEAYKILENLQKTLKPQNVYVAEISRGISEDWGET
ncbi:MAG: hypothetical protein C0190_05650 [Thermodesulfobacterium geofontis]|uniref:Adenosylmethionine decarboxylase n=1 Tax=Thermodesulfobacterium geofontis TaxID=1295609 RepID=A0A2N7PMK4_9BACT|nr:MAG: hypothetical protein C0190_05650 [Thermodesulfobacterium geofontis]